VLDDHRVMKLQQTLASLFVSHACWAASVTYAVSENSGACHEVRIPKWSPPPADSTEPWSVSLGNCQYELRTPSQAEIYVGLSCGTQYWKMNERYSVDLSNSRNVRPIDETSWNAAPVVEFQFPTALQQSTYQPDGLKYRDHLLAKSGPKWDGGENAAASLANLELQFLAMTEPCGAHPNSSSSLNASTERSRAPSPSSTIQDRNFS